MRIGQSIQHEKWDSAMMTTRRLTQTLQQLEFTEFDRQLTGLRQNISRKNKEECKNILSIIIAKRIKLLQNLK